MRGRGAGELVEVVDASGQFNFAGSEHHVLPARLGQRSDLVELGELRFRWDLEIYALGVRADDVAVVGDLGRSSQGIDTRGGTRRGTQRMVAPGEAIVLALQDGDMVIRALIDARNLLDRPPGRADAVQAFDGDIVAFE